VTKKIIHFPFYPENTYQSNIFAGLKKIGYEVITEDRLESAVSRLSADSGICLIHQHWLTRPEKIFRSKYLRKIFLPYQIFKRYRLLKSLKKRNIKLVWTVHNLYPHDLSNSFIVEKLYHKMHYELSDRIIVHSSDAIELIKKEWGGNEDKYRVINHPNYIGESNLSFDKNKSCSILGLNPNKIRFISFGKIRPYKNIDHLVEIFSKYGHLNIELLIAGNISKKPKELRDKLKAKIDICGNVKLMEGYIENDTLAHCMAASDVAVFAYDNTLTSGAALMAMSYSKPCLVPRTSAFTSVLDEKGAFFYNSNDTDDIEKVLKFIINNKNEFERMGQYNYKKVYPIDSDYVAGQIDKIYKELLF
jgi:beta-1,4-mannosyltransferase